MLHLPPASSPRTSWLLAGGWGVVIYLTIPVARQLQDTVLAAAAGWRGARAEDLFAWLVTLLAVVLVTALAIGLARQRRLMARHLLFLPLIVLAFAALAFSLDASPVESLHLAQYGVLALLILRALSHRLRNLSAYPLAALLAGLVGFGDELVQWVLPQRFWDLRDIWLNFLGGALALLGYGLAVRPDSLSRRPDAASWRRLARWSMAATAGLALVLAATPVRLQALGDTLPGLSALTDGTDALGEYGRMIEIPGTGRVRSRLSRQALIEADRARAGDAARAMAALGAEEDYTRFLATHSPGIDPFLYQFRVHLFRRDRYLAAALAAPEPGDREALLFVAAREDAILQALYPETLAETGSRLDAGTAKLLDDAQDPGRPYTSAAGSTLITWAGERELLGALGLVFLVLLAGERLAGRRQNRGKIT
ncbi:MAG: VanZ family protein [Alphaproteobacteria bacterium]